MQWFQQVVSCSRYLVVVAVLGCMLSGITVLFLAFKQTIHLAVAGWTPDGALTVKEVALGFLEAVDLFLIAIVFYIVALGLYELFIDESVPVPAWLRIRTLDDLKNKLLRLIVVVLTVYFLGAVANWSGENTILPFGASIALMIAALTWFLTVSGSEPH